MNHEAILIILRYLNSIEELMKIDTQCGDETFFKRSCSKWVANEILQQLIAQEPVLPGDYIYRDVRSPIEIISTFTKEMKSCSKIGKNKNRFLCAVEAADDILCLFL